MKFEKKLALKNGKLLFMRSGTFADGEEVLRVGSKIHGESDYLLSYPDEDSFNGESEGKSLLEKAQSAYAVEILAIVDDMVVGSAGIEPVERKFKARHRADFSISVLKDYWGMGIGRALTEACIECARQAGYMQLELGVVSENATARYLYESVGFVEFGRNPMGFRSRYSGMQELIYMRLEL